MNNEFYEHYARKKYFAMTGKLASEAMARKAESGISPGCAPIGYRNVIKNYQSAIELDPKVAPLVRQAFELAATGRYSLRSIQKIMTEKGLVSRNGKTVGVKALWYVLTNPFYTGRLLYKHVLIFGRHKSIVKPILFYKVQEQLKANRRR